MIKIIAIFLAFISISSFAKIDDISKNNLFNLPFNAQNMANIKVAGVLLVGTACLKGIMDLNRGTGHWHAINQNIRTASAGKLRGELESINNDEVRKKFLKKYDTNLKRLDRREKFDDMWFGFSRTLMTLAPIGLAAYLFKS